MTQAKTQKPNKTQPGEAEVDLATAIGNPWRFRILYATSLEDLSPSAFVRDHGGEISNISRHFRQLAKWGYLEVVEKKTGGTRRGGVEHVYRNGQRAHLDTPASRGLPQFLRNAMSNTILTSYFERVSDAAAAGTLDADVDRHLSWIALTLDSQAFAELGELLDDVLARLPELEKAAKRRLVESGGEPIETTAALASFRSPAEPKPK
jgi:hypothetical protein